MTDTSDSVRLVAAASNPQFQDRCRLRFLAAAISVTSEVLAVTTNALTAAASNVLHFASTTGVLQGMTVSDLFAGAVIPVGSIVESVVLNTSVTINNNVIGAGVASGDVINFAPVSHAQRAAFAGALFSGNVDLKMLAMLVLANSNVRAACIAVSDVMTSNILDADIDIQVGTVLTGIATSRSW